MIIATDLEGTLTTGDSRRGLIDYLQTHGRGLACRKLKWGMTPRALLARLGLTDERAYRSRWLTEMATLFRGMDRAELRDIANWVVDHELWPSRRTDVMDELLAKQQVGWLIILVSAAYQPILEAFGERIGAEAVGTELETEGGLLTGRLIGSINSGRVKAERLLAELDGEPIYAAYGDAETDIPMLQLSEEPVAVHPDAALRKEAVARGWRIIG